MWQEVGEDWDVSFGYDRMGALMNSYSFGYPHKKYTRSTYSTLQHGRRSGNTQKLKCY